MIFFDIIEFNKTLKPEHPLLGLDIGKVRIGCAVCDTQKFLATPYQLFDLKKQKFSFEIIEKIIKEKNIYGIVVGYPIQMDGNLGDSCLMVDKFIQKHLARLNQPIFLQDERLSSTAVNRYFQEMNLNRKKQTSLIDKASANYILQMALDKLQYLNK